MAVGWRSGGEGVATYPRTHDTHDTDGRSASKEAGAAAPSGENAGTVVAEYVRVRAAAGMFTAKPHRAILGREAKKLLAGGEWSPASLSAAIRAFAATKRHPAFFSEWVLEAWTRSEIAAHEERKADESVFVVPLPSLRRMA